MTHYTSQALLANCINKAFVLCVKHGNGTLTDKSDLDAIVEIVRKYDTSMYEYITNLPESDYLTILCEAVASLVFGTDDIDLRAYTDSNKTVLADWVAEIENTTMSNADGR